MEFPQHNACRDPCRKTGAHWLARPSQLHNKFRRPEAPAEIAACDPMRRRCGAGGLPTVTPGDDDELVEARRQCQRQRRQRKSALSPGCAKAARQAGADRVIVDGVLLIAPLRRPCVRARVQYERVGHRVCRGERPWSAPKASAAHQWFRRPLRAAARLLCPPARPQERAACRGLPWSPEFMGAYAGR